MTKGLKNTVPGVHRADADVAGRVGRVLGAEVGAAHERGMIPSPRGLDNPSNAFFREFGGVWSGATRRRRSFGSAKHVGLRIREEAS